jgi:hypothetical protein
LTHLRRRTLVLCALAAAAAAIAVSWLRPGDAVLPLRAQAMTLRAVERAPAPDLGERVERWRLLVDGDTLSALWRAAAPGHPSPWTVVLLGGLVTGERATLLVPDDARAHLLAVDWPWREPRRMPWWRVALRLGAIRRAVLRSPAVLAVGVQAAARAPEVDRRRIAITGVSLGVPPAVAALELTPEPAALVLLHGAADLRALIAHGLARQGMPRLLAAPLAAVAAGLIRPLEPTRHAGVEGPRPVLLVNAAADPLLPASAVARLHALFPAAEVRWRAGLHGAPDRRAAVAEATREVEDWLAGPVARTVSDAR